MFRFSPRFRIDWLIAVMLALLASGATEMIFEARRGARYTISPEFHLGGELPIFLSFQQSKP